MIGGFSPSRSPSLWLQSRSIVISQQAEFINNLIASLTDLFNVLLADEAHADNSISLESLQISYGDVVALIEDQGSFAMECFNRLDTVGKEEVVKQVALYVMRVLLGLNNVKAERDSNNDPLYDELRLSCRHNSFQCAREHLSRMLSTCFEHNSRASGMSK
jgi:hypothetical protein